ncbi:MAG: hypothetical protein JST55_14750 [Bacteroidetes bacterium]|nr:hypothetical protein [Bacteroidota bacterium]
MLDKIKFYFKFSLSAVVFMLLLFSCGNTPGTTGKYKIVLNGTDKLRYTGFYKTISPSGAVNSNTVQGVLPAEYFLEDCKSLVCSFTMEANRGELNMTVLDENGNELRNETTNMSYGSVQLTTDF